MSTIHQWHPSRDDAGNGTGTLNDLVGTNNGSMPNGMWEANTDAGGVRCMNCSGPFTNDYVTLGNVQLTSAASWSLAWWSIQAAQNDEGMLIGDRTANNYGWFFSSGASGTGNDFRFKMDTDLYDIELPVARTNWSHYAIIFDVAGGLMRWYQNGSLCQIFDSGYAPQGTQVSGVTAGFLFNNLGDAWSGSSVAFAGKFDSFFVFDHVLTQQEISDLAVDRMAIPGGGPGPAPSIVRKLVGVGGGLIGQGSGLVAT